MGAVEPETLATTGLSAADVSGVRHWELFERLLAALDAETEKEGGAPLTAGDAVSGAAAAWASAMEQTCRSSLAAGVGALGLGTESIVAKIYAPMLAAIRRVFPGLKPRCTAFLRLHLVADDAHGETLLRAAEDIAKSCAADFDDVKRGMSTALEARAAFWNEMLARAQAMPPVRAAHRRGGHFASRRGFLLPTLTEYPRPRPNLLQLSPVRLRCMTHRRPRTMPAAQHAAVQADECVTLRTSLY